MASFGGLCVPWYHRKRAKGAAIFQSTFSSLFSLFPLTILQHDYKAVMQHGPNLFFRALNDVLAHKKLSVSDIRLFVPHQANGSVAREASKYMGVPEENIFQNFHLFVFLLRSHLLCLFFDRFRVGNTANGSCMIALDQIATENKLSEGDLVLVGSAESTKWLYATILLRWTAMKGEKNYSNKQRFGFFVHSTAIA